MNHEQVKQRFLEDVKNHEMEIIYDNNSNRRHVRFKSMGSSNCYFDLITWPGHLCYTGDMGTYVFQRTTDMFAFFRQNYGRYHELKINSQYWAEKCLSESIFGEGIRKYSQEKFEDAVTREFVEYVKATRRSVDLGNDMEREKFGNEMRDIWSDIQSTIFGAENEWEAMDSIYSFNGPDYLFQDFWEVTITEYTFHFLWCLYAIVWGISQYDERSNNGL